MNKTNIHLKSMSRDELELLSKCLHNAKVSEAMRLYHKTPGHWKGQFEDEVIKLEGAK